MKTIYYWIGCQSCVRRQYIGANLDGVDETISVLLQHCNNEETKQHAERSLHGLGTTLTMCLKFIALHNGHRLEFITTTDDVDNYSDYKEEWEIYDSGTITTPAWKDIVPIGMTESDIKRAKEIETLTTALHQAKEMIYNLRMRIDATTDGERMRIAKEFKEMCDKQGWQACGPQIIETDDLIAPDIVPQKQRTAIDIIAETVYTNNVEETDTE